LTLAHAPTEAWLFALPEAVFLDKKQNRPSAAVEDVIFAVGAVVADVPQAQSTVLAAVPSELVHLVWTTAEEA